MEKEKMSGTPSNWVGKNLMLALVYFVALIILISVPLAIYTRHSKIQTVPDFTGLSVTEAQVKAQEAGVCILVADSVYVRRMEKGAVFTQNPVAFSKVKPGRTVRLTVNAMNAKKVSMPNLVGLSMRQAKSELSSRGLRLGRLIYRNDMATNNVLDQTCRGVSIAAGSQIETGSFVDLVLGLNSVDNMTVIPDITGLKYQRACDEIQDNYLNIRTTVFDHTVRSYADTIAAVAWKQRPEPSRAAVPMGSQVTLYFTLDESRVPQKTEM